jgi:hypothetical protein
VLLIAGYADASVTPLSGVIAEIGPQ